MLFRVRDRLFNLAHPLDFVAFPMSLGDKVRFAMMMARAFRKSDWSDWQDRSAVDLIDSWSSPGVREALFEPLTRLKFWRNESRVRVGIVGVSSTTLDSRCWVRGVGEA